MTISDAQCRLSEPVAGGASGKPRVSALGHCVCADGGRREKSQSGGRRELGDASRGGAGAGQPGAEGQAPFAWRPGAVLGRRAARQRVAGLGKMGRTG